MLAVTVTSGRVTIRALDGLLESTAADARSRHVLELQHAAAAVVFV